MTLGARFVTAEQSVRLLLTVREWETLTDPATVEGQIQEASERIRLCKSAPEVFAVLNTLPNFDEGVMDRCNEELLPLLPEELLVACWKIQEQEVRRTEIRATVRRALREEGKR